VGLNSGSCNVPKCSSGSGGGRYYSAYWRPSMLRQPPWISIPRYPHWRSFIHPPTLLPEPRPPTLPSDWSGHLRTKSAVAQTGSRRSSRGAFRDSLHAVFASRSNRKAWASLLLPCQLYVIDSAVVILSSRGYSKNRVTHGSSMCGGATGGR
jgi:hypothetical protein